jgi:hypothetical protein
MLFPWLGFHGLLVLGAAACALGLVVLLADAVALRRPAQAPLPARR